MVFVRRLAAALVTLAVLTGPASAAAPKTERVVLAGGCFWGMEAVFGELRGVVSATPGYAGGRKETAHYEIVSTGLTGHAESVEVVYDPAVIAFPTLLDVYFRVAHDPTARNRQGPDVGSQYRSEIFTTTDAQTAIANATIKRLDAAHTFGAPIVTLVEPLHGFYAAEAYHRHYLQNHPDEPYIVSNDLPKLQALHERYPRLVAKT